MDLGLQSFQGLPVFIEYQAGTVKPDPGSFYDSGYLMYADYGYIPDTVSTEEGEDMDVFVGKTASSQLVFLATLMKKDDPEAIDEIKVLLGFQDDEEAQKFMRCQYDSCQVGVIHQTTLKDLMETVSTQASKADLEDSGMSEGRIDVPEDMIEAAKGGTAGETPTSNTSLEVPVDGDMNFPEYGAYGNDIDDAPQLVIQY